MVAMLHRTIQLPQCCTKMQKHKVFSGKDEYTPTGFETLAGKAACRKWRLSLRWAGQPEGCFPQLTVLLDASTGYGRIGCPRESPWCALLLPPHESSVWMPDGGRGMTLGQWLEAHGLEHTVPLPGKRKQAAEEGAALAAEALPPSPLPPRAAAMAAVEAIRASVHPPSPYASARSAASHHSRYSYDGDAAGSSASGGRGPSLCSPGKTPAAAAAAYYYELQQRHKQAAAAAALSGGGQTVEVQQRPSPIKTGARGGAGAAYSRAAVEIGPTDDPITPLTALLNAYFSDGPPGEAPPLLRPSSEEKNGLLALLSEELPSSLPPHLQPPIISLPSFLADEAEAAAGAAAVAAGGSLGPAPSCSGLSLGSAGGGLGPLGSAGLDGLAPAASWPADLIRMPPELAVSDAGIAALARTLPDSIGGQPAAPTAPSTAQQQQAAAAVQQQLQQQDAGATPSSRRLDTPPRASPLLPCGGSSGSGAMPGAAGRLQALYEQRQAAAAATPAAAGLNMELQPEALLSQPAVERMGALKLHSPTKQPRLANSYSVQAFAGGYLGPDPPAPPALL